MADAVASFAARYPRITLELDESQRYVDLIAERFDPALRAGSLADSSLVARRLFAGTSGIYASPAYLKRHRAPRLPADLAAHRFVILEGRARFDRARLRSGSREAEVPLTGNIIATTTGTQRALALAGAGAILHGHRFIADAVADGRLVRLLPAWSTEPAPLWIVTPSRRLLPRKTVLFIEHLVATLGSDPAAAGEV